MNDLWKLLIGLFPFFMPTSLHSQTIPTCFFSESCWTSTWESASDAYGASRGSTTPQATVSDNEEASLWLRERSRLTTNCQAQAPHVDWESVDLSDAEALASFFDQNAEAISTLLSCDFFPEQVAQIMEYPAEMIGTHPNASEVLQPFVSSHRHRTCRASFAFLRAYETKELEAPLSVVEFIFSIYFETCFEDVGKLPEDYHRRVGILTIGGSIDTAYCLGFLVSPEVFLTAKHCLVDPSELNRFHELHGFGSSAKDIALSNVSLRYGTKLVLPGIEPYVFDIRLPNPPIQQDLNFYPASPESDIIILDAPGVGSDLQAFSIREPKKWDPLEIVGLVQRESTNLQEITPDSASLVLSDMIVDKKPSCYAAEVKRGCLIHQCQTIAGFSGSPIFSTIQGETSLVGVHSGFMGIRENVCDFRRSTIIRNRGVPLLK